MTYSIASPDSRPTPLTAEHLAALLPCYPALAQIAQLLIDFPTNPVTPAATHQLETVLQNLLREAGRCALEHTLNNLEPDEVEAPPERRSGGNRYRRRRKSTQTSIPPSVGCVCGAGCTSHAMPANAVCSLCKTCWDWWRVVPHPR